MCGCSVASKWYVKKKDSKYKCQIYVFKCWWNKFELVGVFENSGCHTQGRDEEVGNKGSDYFFVCIVEELKKLK